MRKSPGIISVDEFAVQAGHVLLMCSDCETTTFLSLEMLMPSSVVVGSP